MATRMAIRMLSRERAPDGLSRLHALVDGQGEDMHPYIPGYHPYTL
jgi:hypothetical protein